MFIVQAIKKLISSGALTSISLPLLPIGSLLLFMFSYDITGTNDRIYCADFSKAFKNLVGGITFLSTGILLTPWGLNYLMRPLVHMYISADVAKLICSKEYPEFNIENNMIWAACYTIPFLSAAKYIYNKKNK